LGEKETFGVHTRLDSRKFPSKYRGVGAAEMNVKKGKCSERTEIEVSQRDKHTTEEMHLQSHDVGKTNKLSSAAHGKEKKEMKFP